MALLLPSGPEPSSPQHSTHSNDTFGLAPMMGAHQTDIGGT